MRLELKHLAAYLPYGLQCEIVNWSEAKGRYETHRTTMDSVYADGTCTFHDLVESDHGFHSIKPILRPLKDLVKEIEHNGKKFIPIMFLFGGEDYVKYDYKIEIVDRPILGERIDISVNGIGDSCITFNLKTPVNNMLTYDGWQLLYELHFDVFGLIDEGLAIDVNTLNQK